MKVVSFIPFWNQYEYESKQLVDRDTKRLSGQFLINYPIELANKINSISNTYLFTNDKRISELVDSRLKFEVIGRDIDLDSQSVSVEEIIRSFLNNVQADVVVLLHPKSPFVKKESLEECINMVISGQHDSAFLAKIERKFAWYQGKRINYDVKHGTPHLSAIEPIILETSSAYVFTRESFQKNGTRIGKNPYIKPVGSFEGLVISTPEDIKVAEYLLDSQFNVDD